jgi:hypothetical protein
LRPFAEGGFCLSADDPDESPGVIDSNGEDDEPLEPGAKYTVKTRRELVAKRVTVWLLFGAIFGLMPLFAVTLKEIFSADGFSLDGILKGGDLFIISAVLSAGALGELLAVGRSGEEMLCIVGGFFCLVCFAGNTIAYVVSGNAAASEVATASLVFFPPTLLASGLCVGMAAYG